jgi:hypothetical protein
MFISNDELDWDNVHLSSSKDRTNTLFIMDVLYIGYRGVD